jgi:hypothetical protein
MRRADQGAGTRFQACRQAGAVIVFRLGHALAAAAVIVSRYGRYTTETAHNDPHVRLDGCAWCE